MQRDFISQYQATGFYLDLESHTYGVCINIKDFDRKDEILEHYYSDSDNQASIEAWKKELARTKKRGGISK